ncbi:hypothetical protein BVZ80_01809B, partial [Haemophilus influenzae]
RRFLHKRNGRI